MAALLLFRTSRETTLIPFLRHSSRKRPMSMVPMPIPRISGHTANMRIRALIGDVVTPRMNALMPEGDPTTINPSGQDDDIVMKSVGSYLSLRA